MTAVADLDADAYHKVIDYLYIGDKNVAKNLDVLQSLGITHIVNATVEVRNYFENKSQIKYLQCGVLDSDVADLTPFFDVSARFIHDAVEEGHNVLVHCQQGVSRSASLIIAYLMKYQGYTLAKAYTTLRSARSVVKPKPNFLKQLARYEQRIKKEQQRLATAAAAAAAGGAGAVGSSSGGSTRRAPSVAGPPSAAATATTTTLQVPQALASSSSSSSSSTSSYVAASIGARSRSSSATTTTAAGVSPSPPVPSVSPLPLPSPSPSPSPPLPPSPTQAAAAAAAAELPSSTAAVADSKQSAATSEAAPNFSTETAAMPATEASVAVENVSSTATAAATGTAESNGKKRKAPGPDLPPTKNSETASNGNGASNGKENGIDTSSPAPLKKRKTGLTIISSPTTSPTAGRAANKAISPVTLAGKKSSSAATASAIGAKKRSVPSGPALPPHLQKK